MQKNNMSGDHNCAHMPATRCHSSLTKTEVMYTVHVCIGCIHLNLLTRFLHLTNIPVLAFNLTEIIMLLITI